MSTHADIAVTPTRELPQDDYNVAVQDTANEALDRNVIVTGVGLTADGLFLTCRSRCCLERAGVLVAVPDVVAVELALAGHDVATGAWTAIRGDGRRAYLFRGMRADSALRIFAGEGPQ
ncbi:hypothetical protein [uncultured Pseudokineococcus sp.]|uniref:hypothetical protein n=1 Tax=uncultured Pseudokineococcus sp. TaxID=1642928 RepID=UPI00262121C7|nr:hypothetical protein [uncultured Pseudokineococcus sp.]